MVLVETFVDVSRFAGTCYRAANWRMVGHTRGFRRRGSGYGEASTPKRVFVYPPPSSKALFAAAAERNHHLGVLARGLIALLNAHGPVALERAIAAALQSDAAYLGGVRHFIDQHRKQSDKPPPLALDLPDDPRLRTLSVRPHDLADYDRLNDPSDSGDEEQSRDDDNEQDNSG